MSLRIVIADDQELVREGLATILGAVRDMEVVGLAPDGQEAIRLTSDHAPDVVLMDVRMPGTDGLAATRAVLARPGATTRVIILTTFDTDEHVFDAMRAGASGFLLKDVPKQVLVEAIRAVHQGELMLAPAVTRRLVERHLTGAPDPARVADLTRLSPREVEVLARIASGDANAEIAERLFVSESTVKTHVGSLLQKLGARDRVQLVIFGYECGLVRPGDSGRPP